MTRSVVPATTVPGRRGRRPGPSTTRAEILDAARELFGTNGFDGTTLRMIAEAAGVDPALVARSYGDKDGLFRAAVAWPWDPMEVVPAVARGPKRSAGYRLAGLIVDTWEDPAQRASVLALVTSSAVSDAARTMLRDFITREVLVPFVRLAGFDEPELRGALLGAQNLELTMARYVLRIEPLASCGAEMLTELLGRADQHVLTMTLPTSHTTTAGAR
jgi:AcrR family transcriptional regulator